MNNKYITRRFIAGFIDYFIVLFPLTQFYIFEFGELNNEGGYSVNGLKTLPIIIFWLIYFCGSETFLGKTLGNFFVNLKPVDKITGRNVTFKQSFARHILDLIDMFLFGLVAIIVIKNSKENQRLGDLLAKTKIIKI